MIGDAIKRHLPGLGSSDIIVTPAMYRTLRRKITALMLITATLPLAIMAWLNYHEYQKALSREIQNPLRVIVNKSKNSFELFLAERTSAVGFIAQAYSFRELADEKDLARILKILQTEYVGFVDLGLINDQGELVNYVGPYALKGHNYAEQTWFNEVRVKGRYISDVFMGFRKFPHVVVAVRHTMDSGESFIVRATLDTHQFDKIISSMGLEPGSDAFLLSRAGVLQTNSQRFGKVLDQFSLPMPPPTSEATVLQQQDAEGNDIFLAYAYFPESDFVLAAIKPKAQMLRTWYTVRGDLVFIFVAGVLAVFLASYKITDQLLRRMREAEEARELALRQVEHSQKLSSIGRLAAGVAHEINNPLAVINEKTGLMRDLIGLREEFPDKERFLVLIDSVLKTVMRCRDITRRMLGFARRLDVTLEEINLNDVITETSGFLNQEALHRKIELTLNLEAGMPGIVSDRGQLQQVFLNILNNALAAVPDGGHIEIRTMADAEGVTVVVRDNGCGMSKDTMACIFEPFFTTKKTKGTGLGLSITYGIVKRLGGEIGVESELDKGTAFTLRFPKHPKHEA
jgi:two-component system NtrC family sensor kinase